jgi:hypothetical protein
MLNKLGNFKLSHCFVYNEIIKWDSFWGYRLKLYIMQLIGMKKNHKIVRVMDFWNWKLRFVIVPTLSKWIVVWLHDELQNLLGTWF